MKLRILSPMLAFAALLSLAAQAPEAQARTIHVDGFPADWDDLGWPMDPPALDNLGHLGRSPAFDGEFIWRDQPGDERTDFSSPDPLVDLVELRTTGDMMHVYFLARFRDIQPWQLAGNETLMLQIAISTNATSVTPRFDFVGLADTRTSPNAPWNFLLQTQFGSGAGVDPDSVIADIMVHLADGTASPTGMGFIRASTSTVELLVPWAAFGLSGPPPSPVRLTTMVCRSTPGNDCWDIGGPNISDALDAVSNYGRPGGTDNTWAEVSDNTVDYHFQVFYGRTGEVQTPLMIHELFPSQGAIDQDTGYLQLINMTSGLMPLEGYKIGDAEVLGSVTEGMALLHCGTLGAFQNLLIASNADHFQRAFGYWPDYSLRPTAGLVAEAREYPAWASGTVYWEQGGRDQVLVLDPYDTLIDYLEYQQTPTSWPGHANTEILAPPGMALWRFQLADTNDMRVDFMPFQPQPDPSLCGDGTVECQEACDEGALNGTTLCGCQSDCSLPPDGASCEDGLWCNGAETCQGGACTAGAPPCTATQFCNEHARECVGGAPLVINELDYDQPGSDTAEFIELKNATGSELALAGFELVLVNGNGGGAAIYRTIALPDAVLPAGGYFVVCGNAGNVPNCNLVVPVAQDLIQNGAPDAVGLRFGGVLIDAASYEGDTGAPYTEGSGVGLIDDGTVPRQGLSRFPDGVDTDVNNADLSPRCISPGGPNLARVDNCLCGNGSIDPGEACDEGEGNGATACGCQTDCQYAPLTSLCPDGLYCNGEEHCDGAGACVAGSAVDCDDGVACTQDTCDESQAACVHAPDHALCQDGMACNGAESCHPTQGCVAGTPLDCDDGVACTQDACVELAGGCVNQPQDAACDDGDVCNGAETCSLTQGCQAGTPLTCDDGVFCNGAESCDPTQGCLPGSPPSCAHLDGPCVLGVCDPVMDACQAVPVADELPCDDGDACTAGDACNQGVCTGTLIDADGDGYGPGAACGGDCDDTDASIFPGAEEICGDGIDQDCNGQDLQCGCPDADGDGFQDAACGGTDCNDADATIFPGAEEICGDGIDQDCDGQDLACTCPDADGDGFQDAACGGTDCNDADATIFPGAEEICGDGIDQDCDGQDLACTCPDADGDGFQDAACGGTDCNDADATIFPGAEEICGDGIDQDCNGQDLECGCPDADEDGYFDAACGGTDCNDADATIFPGAEEICGDGIDQDCSGADLPCPCLDADGDGYQDATCGGTDCDDTNATIFPGATENCTDGVDNNCDGLTDLQDPACQVPDASSGCGCGTGGGPAQAGLLGLLLLGLALARRRRF